MKTKTPKRKWLHGGRVFIVPIQGYVGDDTSLVVEGCPNETMWVGLHVKGTSAEIFDFGYRTFEEAKRAMPFAVNSEPSWNWWPPKRAA